MIIFIRKKLIILPKKLSNKTSKLVNFKSRLLSCPGTYRAQIQDLNSPNLCTVTGTPSVKSNGDFSKLGCLGYFGHLQTQIVYKILFEAKIY